jgi:hypothetical protein
MLLKLGNSKSGHDADTARSVGAGVEGHSFFALYVSEGQSLAMPSMALDGDWMLDAIRVAWREMGPMYEGPNPNAVIPV